MGGQNYLSTVVPARFLTTLGHLSVSIMVLYQMDDNVIASLPLNYTTSQYDTTHSSLEAAVALTIIFQAAELLSFFSGFSLFSPFINAYDTIAHFIAAVLISWFLMERWHYSTFWIIWAFCSLIPFILELFAVIRVFCCRITKY